MVQWFSHQILTYLTLRPADKKPYCTLIYKTKKKNHTQWPRKKTNVDKQNYFLVAKVFSIFTSILENASPPPLPEPHGGCQLMPCPLGELIWRWTEGKEIKRGGNSVRKTGKREKTAGKKINKVKWMQKNENTGSFLKGEGWFSDKIYVKTCSLSRWRPQKVDKRMVLEYTHGLFIT